MWVCWPNPISKPSIVSAPSRCGYHAPALRWGSVYPGHLGWSLATLTVTKMQITTLPFQQGCDKDLNEKAETEQGLNERRWRSGDGVRRWAGRTSLSSETRLLAAVHWIWWERRTRKPPIAMWLMLFVSLMHHIYMSKCCVQAGHEASEMAE